MLQCMNSGMRECKNAGILQKSKISNLQSPISNLKSMLQCCNATMLELSSFVLKEKIVKYASMSFCLDDKWSDSELAPLNLRFHEYQNSNKGEWVKERNRIMRFTNTFKNNKEWWVKDQGWFYFSVHLSDNFYSAIAQAAALRGLLLQCVDILSNLDIVKTNWFLIFIIYKTFWIET